MQVPHRVAAAVLAFAQGVEALVEPSLALHEFAHTGKNLEAREELIAFRRIDNAPLRVLTDIALGRCNIFSHEPSEPRREVPMLNLERNPREWDCLYVAALKVAELELLSISPREKCVRLIDWMGGEFLFASTALLMGMRYFIPSGPHRRLMKHLRSANRDRAIMGVRNAAWDLTLVSEWASRVKQEDVNGCLWILVSMDKGLNGIARSIFHSSDESPDEAILRMCCSMWGRTDGRALCEHYLQWRKRREEGVVPPLLSREQAEHLKLQLESSVREAVSAIAVSGEVND